MRRTRAAVLLAVYVVLGILAFPGLDFLRPGAMRSERQVDRVRAQVGPFWTGVGVGVARANRAVRHPVERFFAPVERVFRIKQSWSLYRDGPDRVGRLEIRADDDLVYRSARIDLLGLDPALSSRRMRPPVESTVKQRGGGPNWRGVARYAVARVRAARPGVSRVELVATSAPFPGAGPAEQARVARVIVAEAPEWEPWMQ